MYVVKAVSFSVWRDAKYGEDAITFSIPRPLTFQWAFILRRGRRKALNHDYKEESFSYARRQFM